MEGPVDLEAGGGFRGLRDCYGSRADLLEADLEKSEVL